MSRQQYCSYFALVALLFGNVAGLLHVGSHQHHDACHVVQVASEHSQQIEATTQSEGSKKRWHCHCHHHSQSSEQPAGSSPQSSDQQGSNEEGGGHSPCDHDREHCSICQAMAHSSKGSLLDLARIETDAPDVSTAVDTSFRLLMPADQIAGLSARGPPCV